MTVRAVGLVIAGLVVGGGAYAADTIKLLPGPFEFPSEFAAMKYQGEPTRFDDPRLGTGYIFTSDHLLFMVYVFDNGIKDIADGADALVACKAFEDGKVEVQQGPYTEPKLLYEQLVRLAAPDDGLMAREAKYQVLFKGKATNAYLFVTAAAGQILKLRLLASGGHDEELETARREALRLLGVAIKPHPAAQKPEPAKSATSITFYAGNSAADMQAATSYTFSLSTVADRFPQDAPVCGGDFVPTLEEEVATYQVMLGIFGSDDAFSRKLKEIASAEFLAEYAWTFAHRDSWGTTPPAELRLDEFKAWRAKHLTRFKPPAFGTVQFNHPRTLPVDAHPL